MKPKEIIGWTILIVGFICILYSSYEVVRTSEIVRGDLDVIDVVMESKTFRLLDYMGQFFLKVGGIFMITGSILLIGRSNHNFQNKVLE